MSRALVTEVVITPNGRTELGAPTAWARAARELYQAYAEAVERDPKARLVITVSTEKA